MAELQQAAPVKHFCIGKFTGKEGEAKTLAETKSIDVIQNTGESKMCMFLEKLRQNRRFFDKKSKNVFPKTKIDFFFFLFYEILPKPTRKSRLSRIVEFSTLAVS